MHEVAVVFEVFMRLDANFAGSCFQTHLSQTLTRGTVGEPVARKSGVELGWLNDSRSFF